MWAFAAADIALLSTLPLLLGQSWTEFVKIGRDRAGGATHSACMSHLLRSARLQGSPWQYVPGFGLSQTTHASTVSKACSFAIKTYKRSNTAARQP
jgi:hypothetical protein